MTAAFASGVAAAAAAALASYGAWQAVRRYSIRRVAGLQRLAGSDLPQLFVFVDPARLARTMALSLLAATLAALWLGWPPALVVLLLCGWIAAPRLALRWLAGRRRQRLRRELPDGASALATQLRAGMALSQALATLGAERGSALGDELALALRQHRLGLPLDTVLADLARRARLADIDLFVAALRIARELGSGLADALDRLADTLRRRRVIEDRIRALTAQGRMQGIIVSLLPLLIVIALALIEPGATRALVATPTGWAVVSIVVALQGVGWLLIRRIVNIDV